jgi:hypothetical protein
MMIFRCVDSFLELRVKDSTVTSARSLVVLPLRDPLGFDISTIST